jgi:hypothetical protein
VNYSRGTAMGKGSGVRFGSQGQFSSEFQTKEQARRYFLEVVRVVCPHVLVDLRDTIFPGYQAWAKRATRKYQPVVPGAVHPVFRSYVLLQGQAPELAAAIAGWGERFHLVGDLPKLPEWYGQQWYEYARVESLWVWQNALEALYGWYWLAVEKLRSSPVATSVDCGG